jgi:hypothetical protein
METNAAWGIREANGLSRQLMADLLLVTLKLHQDGSALV